jgi:hypothetical protein
MNRLFAGSILGLTVMVFTACESMTGKTAGQSIDDATVTASVQAKLTKDKLSNFSRINVDTDRNVVTGVGTEPRGRRSVVSTTDARMQRHRERQHGERKHGHSRIVRHHDSTLYIVAWDLGTRFAQRRNGFGSRGRLTPDREGFVPAGAAPESLP